MMKDTTNLVLKIVVRSSQRASLLSAEPLDFMKEH